MFATFGMEIVECGALEPHQVQATVDVADVWDLKERAMDQLATQMAFSGAHFRRLYGAETLKILAPTADPDGDPAALGRTIHSATDLVLAEPYRREGVFTFAQLP
jgi:hypothetical protein